MSFYYHMHGVSVGTLILLLWPSYGGAQSFYGGGQSSYGGTRSTKHFSISGEQSTRWQRTAVDIPARNYKSRLVFEATVGQKHLSDIAVDDVTVSFINLTVCYMIMSLISHNYS